MLTLDDDESTTSCSLSEKDLPSTISPQRPGPGGLESHPPLLIAQYDPPPQAMMPPRPWSMLAVDPLHPLPQGPMVAG